MHSLVRRYIKTAIVFLMVGLAIGGWMIVARELTLRPPAASTTSAHTHAILVGFVMMMILGVALWLFPRPEKSDVRYRPAVAEAAYWLLTVGTTMRIAGELVRPATSALAVRWTVVLGGFGQILGLVLFFYTMWSRIRGLGSGLRESKGERF
ncbi:MAG TPA: cbb3-type cytochrome c oxidase subunit I [Gemmatimonadaceae bacterium]|jgi:cbb3-type cytochrome oxidase subunit 1